MQTVLAAAERLTHVLDAVARWQSIPRIELQHVRQQLVQEVSDAPTARHLLQVVRVDHVRVFGNLKYQNHIRLRRKT